MGVFCNWMDGGTGVLNERSLAEAVVEVDYTLVWVPEGSWVWVLVIGRDLLEATEVDLVSTKLAKDLLTVTSKLNLKVIIFFVAQFALLGLP